MKRFAAAFDWILETCGVLGAFLVAALTAMVTLNVLLRNAFGARVPGDVELSEYAMLLITAFVVPWLLRKGQHVRIDLMLHQLPAPGGWFCEIFVDVLGFAVSALMTWYCAKVLFISISDGTRIIKEFTIPEWWTLWPLPMMFVLVTVEFVFRLKRVLSGPRRPRSEGAPL